MYRVSLIGHIDSAHLLRGYVGPCGSMHGHRWTFRTYYETSTLQIVGFVEDFKDLKTALGNIIDIFDHKVINEISPFTQVGRNPTAENLAEYTYKMLKLEKGGDKLVKVRVYESPDSYAEYYE